MGPNNRIDLNRVFARGTWNDDTFELETEGTPTAYLNRAVDYITSVDAWNTLSDTAEYITTTTPRDDWLSADRWNVHYVDETVGRAYAIPEATVGLYKVEVDKDGTVRWFVNNEEKEFEESEALDEFLDELVVRE